MSADNYGIIVKHKGEFYVGNWAAPTVDAMGIDEMEDKVRKAIDEGVLHHLPDVADDDEAEDWIFDQWQVEYGCLFFDFDEDTSYMRDFTEEYQARLKKMGEALEFAFENSLIGNHGPDEQVEALVGVGVPRDTLFLVIESMRSYSESRTKDKVEARNDANHLIAGAVVGLLAASKYHEGSES